MEYQNKTCFEDLPEGLVMDILSRLPVKSLIRSTSVRKEWYSLIKSVSFISLHLSRSVSDPRSYVFLTSCHSCMFALVKDNHLLTHDSPEQSIFKFIIGRNTQKVFVSSCRGLVCMEDWWWDGGYNIYLINPFVRKYKEIELESSCYADLIREMKPNKMDPSEGDWIRINFGYSEIEDDYKILRMIIPKYKKSLSKVKKTKKSATKVEIYSLKSGTWKSVDFPTEIEIDLMAPDVYVLGSLYWVIQNDTRYLLCFDLKVEVFSKIELPKPYWKLPVYHIFNKNDSLVLLSNELLEDYESDKLEMCVLMLEEEKNVEGHKWKECSYTFSCDDIDCESDLSSMPLGFTIGGRLIFSVQHTDDDPDNKKDFLVAVDLDNKCVIEKFKFNFREHLIEGLDEGLDVGSMTLINGATNVLESLVLFSG